MLESTNSLALDAAMAEKYLSMPAAATFAFSVMSAAWLSINMPVATTAYGCSVMISWTQYAFHFTSQFAHPAMEAGAFCSQAVQPSISMRSILNPNCLPNTSKVGIHMSASESPTTAMIFFEVVSPYTQGAYRYAVSSSDSQCACPLFSAGSGKGLPSSSAAISGAVRVVVVAARARSCWGWVSVGRELHAG